MHFCQVLTVLVGAASLAACDAREQRGAVRSAYVDDFGDTVRVSRAERIVSLNPTTTEILFAIGAGSRLVGRTRYDRWPEAAQLVPDLGPGIRPSAEAILAARPDLVVLYAGSDNQSVARALRAAGVTVVGLKIDRIADFARATMILGASTGDTARARLVVDSVTRTLEQVRRERAAGTGPTVVWHLWDSPLLVVGAGSYQSELLEIAGARNTYADQPTAAATTSIEDIARRDPDVVLTDVARASTIHASPRWRAVRAVREGRVIAIDPDLASRTSVTLGMAAVELARLLRSAPGAR